MPRPFSLNNTARISGILLISSFQLAVSGAPVSAQKSPQLSPAAKIFRVKPAMPVKRLKASSDIAIVNAASYLPGVSPGGIATIFGQNLSTVTGIVQGGSEPLSTEIQGVSVIVNGVYAPLYYVAFANGEDQISFQVPYETPVGIGAVIVQILNFGQVIANVQADSFTEDPGIFTYNGNYAVAVRYPDYTVIGPNNPAQPGDILTLYTTGLGPLTVSLVDGYGAPDNPLAYTQDPFQVLVNGQGCSVSFSGLAPGFVGLDQINLQLPFNLPQGNLDIQITTPYASSSASAAVLPVI